MSPTQPVKKYYFSVLGQRLNVNRFQPKLNILPFHRLQFRFHHGQLRLQLRVRVPCFFRLCLSLRGLLDLSCCCSPQKTATHAGFKRPVDWNPDQNGLGNARRGRLGVAARHTRKRVWLGAEKARRTNSAGAIRGMPHASSLRRYSKL